MNSHDTSDGATYRPESIAVKAVAVMVALHPDVAARYLDVAVLVTDGSGKKQHKQGGENSQEIKQLGTQGEDGKNAVVEMPAVLEG